MPILEGLAVDGSDGSPIIFGVIQVRDQTKRNIIATTSTDEHGEFSVEVPEQKIWCCLFGQIYQPVCFKVTEPDTGEWTPVPPEGRRVRIESVKITLAPAGE